MHYRGSSRRCYRTCRKTLLTPHAPLYNLRIYSTYLILHYVLIWLLACGPYTHPGCAEARRQYYSLLIFSQLPESPNNQLSL
ncbi:hypothetical protein EV356DRAFT_498468 [Viridothelium virens]|uniref:Uncharacterized protein n=1 Tax=Viridothelium virens TaxID=1048519 RepID=A0A6A6HEB4_VIRVR|nr:hypothetical protein EV356DRAFT_498468 [Viridothelium virens]